MTTREAGFSELRVYIRRTKPAREHPRRTADTVESPLRSEIGAAGWTSGLRKGRGNPETETHADWTKMLRRWAR